MRKQGNRWTNEEIEKLKELYPKYGSKGLVNIFNRKDSAIRAKAIRLKIKYKKLKIKYFEENLRPIVENSKDINECLRKMNIRTAGGNHKTIKKYIEEYNINTDHFIKKEKSMSKLHIFNTIPLEEILVENSTYNNNTNLKKRILKANLIKYKCKKCKNPGEWNGEKLVLQLDHKNGIHDDNRINNLQFLCPNCHSQTKTFAGRNIKNRKEKYYCDCGNQILKQSKKCKSCVAKSRRKVERPSYDQLIKEVEELGYSGTGRKYNVSDNAIRKWINSNK